MHTWKKRLSTIPFVPSWLNISAATVAAAAAPTFKAWIHFLSRIVIAQSAGAVEYTDCFSAGVGKILPRNDCPRYDTKQSDGEAPVMLELWGMKSTPSLLSLSGQLWSGVVAPGRVLFMGQIELKCGSMLNWIAWNKTVLHLNCM